MGILDLFRSQPKTINQQREQKDERRAECPNCHEQKLQHRACPNCGFYDGRSIIIPKES